MAPNSCVMIERFIRSFSQITNDLSELGSKLNRYVNYGLEREPK